MSEVEVLIKSQVPAKLESAVSTKVPSETVALLAASSFTKQMCIGLLSRSDPRTITLSLSYTSIVNNASSVLNRYCASPKACPSK